MEFRASDGENDSMKWLTLAPNTRRIVQTIASQDILRSLEDYYRSR
jgi:hypothetical protein